MILQSRAAPRGDQADRLRMAKPLVSAWAMAPARRNPSIDLTARCACGACQRVSAGDGPLDVHVLLRGLPAGDRHRPLHRRPAARRRCHHHRRRPRALRAPPIPAPRSPAGSAPPAAPRSTPSRAAPPTCCMLPVGLFGQRRRLVPAQPADLRPQPPRLGRDRRRPAAARRPTATRSHSDDCRIRRHGRPPSAAARPAWPRRKEDVRRHRLHARRQHG